MPGSPVLFAIVAVVAAVLLAIGGSIGFRFGRKNTEPEEQGSADGLDVDDRERMVQLLRQLGAWTSEYSGNVSQYQIQLGEISTALRGGRATAGSDARIMLLLEQIMKSNEQLKNRLDAAEKQLDKQTRQIESYLTEARTDGLTGLNNRRAFDQKLDEVFGGYRKGGRTFVLAIIDIDHFKRINDTYGHQAGDQVLQQIAATLRNQLRQAIMVARFGGEEFAVILDGPLRSAAEQMNELRKAIASTRLQAGAISIEVTTSIGLGEPRDDMVPAPIVRRADEALYAAKNIGRNRVYYHDGKSPVLVGAPEVSR